MEFIEVQYNQDLPDLESLLKTVTRPGDFYAAGTLEVPLPSIKITGLGALSFPIPATQAAKLAKLATPAPYGRGKNTVTDTNVRNAKQLEPASVQISGKSWPETFDEILAHVELGLGCPEGSVHAELYKLLVYEKGGFFKPHRDTEKSPGMFGTLVITLPGTYSGGALRIRHEGREVTVDTNPESDSQSPSEISFAAFYADCEHEALPVTSGHRVCLVYNLIQDSPLRKSKPLTAPSHGAQIAKAASILDAYWKSPTAPAKIVWLLEHQYSPAGLDFAALKGADAARAAVLLEAAAQCDSTVHLAIVHIEESGAANEHYQPNNYWRDRYYDDFHDNEDDEDDDTESGSEQDGEDFEAVTVDESWRHLDEWRDPQGQSPSFGSIPLHAGELLPDGALDNEPPDEKRLTEASGNAGASYDRAYHRAALVIWPSRATVDVLLQAGPEAALPHLARLADAGPGAPETLRIARKILEAWPTAAQYSTYTAERAAHRASMIASLTQLNAPELLERFLRNILIPHYSGPENNALRQTVATLGPAKAKTLFSDLIATRLPDQPNECADLLHKLAADDALTLDPIAEVAITTLPSIKSPTPTVDDFIGAQSSLHRRHRPTIQPQFAVNLFSALCHCKNESLRKKLCTEAATNITSLPEIFPILKVQIPAILALSGNPTKLPTALQAPLLHLWINAAQHLLSRSETKPQPPTDWRLEANLTCKCGDCAALQLFARNPGQQIARFPLNKERRRHLHNVIDQHKLDMTHKTLRQGSPQTLICIKDRRTHQARMADYRDEIDAMRQLLEHAPNSPSIAPLTQRLESAIEASARP